ncbi:TetR/AcrR family transcriptional regulator [Pseudorhizobium pelagicum]|uniref:TetR/AcrR family transcriptional regulator n=1 Tax=Pseudorhizobium pelagicum TaxID=1509405 RepID=UPI003460FD3D
MERVSVSEVAQELGVSTRYVFKVFRTKLEIADALAARELRRLIDGCERCLAESTSSSVKLSRFLQEPASHWVRTMEVHPGMASVMVTAIERQKRAITSFRVFIAEKVREVTEEGQRFGEFREVDSRQFARTVLDLMSVYGDPRVIHLLNPTEISARSDRVTSFILQAVKHERPVER